LSRRDAAAAERVADAVLAAMGAAPAANPAAASSSHPCSDPEPSARQPLGNVVRLSDVESEPIHWLSPGRLALGKITVLDGDPGLGKSTLLCEFAARVTRGQPLPGGHPTAPRGVIMLAAEDGLFDTIRPRIDAASGDPRRVVSFLAVPDRSSAGRPFALPGDAPLLETVADHADASLVIIDPLAGFLGPRHSANDAGHIRRTLAALREVAERANVAIVIVRHLNKASGANPMYRGGGSIGIIGSARCGLLLAPDPADPNRRILAATKENLTARTPSLAFRLEPDPGSGVTRVVWEDESPLTAAQLLHASAEGDDRRSLVLDARHWLRAELADGPRPAKDMLREATERGLTRGALLAARKAEHVAVSKERVANGRWIWALPGTALEESGDAASSPHPDSSDSSDSSDPSPPLTRPGVADVPTPNERKR
jgi:hypothetical protein